MSQRLNKSFSYSSRIPTNKSQRQNRSVTLPSTSSCTCPMNENLVDPAEMISEEERFQMLQRLLDEDAASAHFFDTEEPPSVFEEEDGEDIESEGAQDMTFYEAEVGQSRAQITTPFASSSPYTTPSVDNQRHEPLPRTSRIPRRIPQIVLTTPRGTSQPMSARSLPTARYAASREARPSAIPRPISTPIRSQQPASDSLQQSIPSTRRSMSQTMPSTSRRSFQQPRTSLSSQRSKPSTSMPRRTPQSAGSRTVRVARGMPPHSRMSKTRQRAPVPHTSDEGLRSFEALEKIYQAVEKPPPLALDASLRSFEDLEQQVQYETELEALNESAAEQMADLVSDADTMYMHRTFEDGNETVMQVPRSGTVSPSSLRQPQVPFASDLSPVRSAYPSTSATEPFYQPGEIQAYAAESGVAGALDVRVDPNVYDDSQWAQTETALTQVEMDLERETQEEIRRIQEALGSDADEFQVIEALVEQGVPEEVIDRNMALIAGPSSRATLDDLDEQASRELRYFREVEQMVQDEADDVDIALKLAQLDIENRPKDGSVPSLKMQPKQRTYTLRRQLRDMHRQTQAFTIAEGDEPEDIQPEVAAAMMHTEERGLHLGDAPQHMFSYLFKGKAGGSSSVDILPAEPGEAQVVPVRLSTQVDSNIVLEGTASDMQQQPDNDLYSATVANENRAGASRGQGPGAESSRSSMSSTQQASVDYYLEPRSPPYFSRVQLRGSLLPPWFPGYFEVLPHTREGVRLTTSPSLVLQAAWENMHPNTFEEESVRLTAEPSQPATPEAVPSPA